MRLFHVGADRISELGALPEALPLGGYLWIACAREELEPQLASLQGALQRWTGGQLVDLHASDLLNRQLPSHFDYTSRYDMLVLRRLSVAVAGNGAAGPDAAGRETVEAARLALQAIDTTPVGFVVFDRVLLSVHPGDDAMRDFFALRLAQQAQVSESRTAVRLPPSPADLMLRMANHIVDGYLDLRRLLTRHLGQLQQELFRPRGRFDHWQALLESRNTLHALEDVCEDQRSALMEWLDSLEEWPAPADEAARRERELLRLRSRDVLEHIERVLSHVRRLESSSEAAVQMHFSSQSNRTNSIMRTLTVLTAIFLPLNLVTGIFGMNFDALPLIHSTRGVWIAFGLMGLLAIGLGLFFWRKRYLGGPH